MKNYTRKGKRFTIDPTMLKGWEDLFSTTDKTVVENECRRTNIDISWKENDHLKMVNREEAIQYHPETRDPVWFNHVQVVLVWGTPVARLKDRMLQSNTIQTDRQRDT